MQLTLVWRGPVGPGQFPEDGDGLAALAAPGVYLRIKRYDGGRTVSYVGQSTRLVVRFDRHLRDILTFTAALRDDAGAVAPGRFSPSPSRGEGRGGGDTARSFRADIRRLDTVDRPTTESARAAALGHAE